MDLKSSPIVKRALRKIRIIVVILLLLEIGCWYGMSHLLSGYYAFWLMVGLMILGYIVGFVFGNPSGVKQTLMNSDRKRFAALMIMPSWIAKVFALFFLLPPLRRGLIRFVTQKFLPKELTSAFSANDNRLGSLFGQGMNVGRPGSYEELFQKMHPSESGHTSDDFDRNDVIDVDYEVNHSKNNMTTVEVERTSYSQQNRMKSLPEAEVIDVPYEWEK